MRSPYSTDWLWGGFGVTIASASASFAAYMIATAPAQVADNGSKDFGIFAHFDRRSGRQTLTASLPRPLAVTIPPQAPSPPTATASAGIDAEPTGSIPPADERVSQVARSPETTPLRDFVVRNVIGNKALIEHRQKLSLVKPGSILDGAGEVLAIERRGDAWVVKTAAGVIGGL